MRFLAQLRMWALMLLARGTAASCLDAELRDHLERQTAENIAAGMSADDARYAALREFGNLALLRDQTRARWSWSQLEGLLRDVRYGVRTPAAARRKVMIVGGGPAGMKAAVIAAQRGHDVSLYEGQRRLGGASLPRGHHHARMPFCQTARGCHRPTAAGVTAAWRRVAHTAR